MINKFRGRIWTLLGTASLCCFVLLNLSAARHDSAAYDEPVHLLSGYAYWATGRYPISDHPPLIRLIASAPLLLQKPLLDTSHRSWLERDAFAAANHFLFHNKYPPEKLLLPPRTALTALSLVLGLILWRWGCLLFDYETGAISVFLFSFLPLFIAHSHLAANDMGLTVFYALALAAAYHYFNSPSKRAAVLLGCAAGLAITAKFSGLMIFPVLFFLAAIHHRRLRTRLRESSIEICLVLAGAAAVLTLLYAGEGAGAYFTDLLLAFKRAGGGSPVLYLNGVTGAARPLMYYPIALLIKLPVPLLALSALALMVNRNSDTIKKLAVWIILPSMAFFAGAMSPGLQELRYILPALPFLCVLAATSAAYLWRKNRWTRLCVIGLAGWHAAGTLSAHPHHISYFNELAGGPSRGYRFLAGSDLEWGQELDCLAKYIKERKAGKIYLSYYGAAEPGAYGISCVPLDFSYKEAWKPDESPDERIQTKALFAVSATNLLGVFHSGEGPFTRLFKEKPEAVLGNSMFIFDATNNAGFHETAALVLKSQGMKELSGDEIRRVESLKRQTGPESGA